MATIRGGVSQALKNTAIHYFTSPNFHCKRAIKQTSSKSNHPIINWTAQLGIRCCPDKRICPSPSRWSFKLIETKLGKSHTGQLDFTDSPRLDVERSQALSKEINDLCQKRAIIPTTKGFVSPVFIVPREMVPSDESQSIECSCCSPTLQDEVNQISKRNDTERRLADKVRSKRCLLDGTSAPLPSEISQILLARPNVAIRGPPIWSKQCSIYIHKTNEASGGNFEEVRDSNNFISGRYAHNGKLSLARQGQRSH